MFDNIDSFWLIMYLIFALIGVIFATIIGILYYSGLFDNVEEVGTGKPYVNQVVIAYKFQKGPYKEAGPIFTEAAIISSQNKALGIYYDDPRKASAKTIHITYEQVLNNFIIKIF